MKELAGKTIWITGASSGIGAALARECSRVSPVTLVLSGRSPERLHQVAEECRGAGATVQLLPFDMADPAARSRALKALFQKNLDPDVLVNNAGISQRSRAQEAEFAQDRVIMETDYLGAVEITKAVLPRMVSRRSGAVLVISSVAGLLPAPLRSGYNAAKAAQIAFFGTLANELAGSGVRVMTIIPGFVRTEISRNALDATGDRWGRMDRNQEEGISPGEAARRILAGFARGRQRLYIGLTAGLRIALILRWLAPGSLDRILRQARVS